MDVEVCLVREHGEPDKPKRQRHSKKESGHRPKTVDIDDADIDPDESSYGDDRQHPEVDDNKTEPGNSDNNPIVIDDSEADDYPTLPKKRKRSRADPESPVSGRRGAKRKGHISSANSVI